MPEVFEFVIIILCMYPKGKIVVYRKLQNGKQQKRENIVREGLEFFA
jgi:hypothetical protein